MVFVYATSNTLAATVEICSEVLVLIISILMVRNGIYARRRALWKKRKLEYLFPHSEGSPLELINIIKGKNWLRSSRILSLLVLILFLISVVIGPTLQSQIIAGTDVNENVVRYTTKKLLSFDHRNSFRRANLRSIEQTYEYAENHGMDSLIEVWNKGVIISPRELDWNNQESILPREDNIGTTITIPIDHNGTCFVNFKDNKVSSVLFNGTNLNQYMKSIGFNGPYKGYQKVNSTYSISGDKWVSQGASVLVATFFRGHKSYFVVLIDVHQNQNLVTIPNQEYLMRLARIEFSEPTPWPELLQEIVFLKLHQVNNIYDLNFIRKAALSLALHWASSAGESKIRNVYVPRSFSNVSAWALLLTVIFVGLVVALLLAMIFFHFRTRKLPRTIDKARTALQYCYRELHNLPPYGDANVTVELSDGAQNSFDAKFLLP